MIFPEPRSVFIVRGIRAWAMKGAVFAKSYHWLTGIAAIMKRAIVLSLVHPPSQYMPSSQDMPARIWGKISLH